MLVVAGQNRVRGGMCLIAKLCCTDHCGIELQLVLECGCSSLIRNASKRFLLGRS